MPWNTIADLHACLGPKTNSAEKVNMLRKGLSDFSIRSKASSGAVADPDSRLQCCPNELFPRIV